MTQRSGLPHFETRVLRHADLAFTALTAGWETHPDGDIIVCLHGFPDNAYTFRHQLSAFSQAGYRVICPTLRGYEPGSIPADKDFGLMAIAEDVVAWCHEFEAEAVHLVGHDWGASITYLAGMLAPDRFASLTTIAVPHGARFAQAVQKVPRQKRLSWYMMFFQLPFIAEQALQYRDWALIRKLWRDWSPGYTLTPDEWESLRATFCAPGVTSAMLAYYRQNIGLAALLGLTKARPAGPTIVPVRTLALTGAQDGCIATEMYDVAMRQEDFPAGLKIMRIEKAGHFAHLERPNHVNDALLNWFANTD